MADLFISYSRKDIAYARLLHKALKENELETWIDWQDIPPSTEWLQEVYSAIEEANTFIFILSASSIMSEICVKEIEHATKNNKRIIPIVINDVEPSKVHPALAAINWIFSRTKDELQPAIENLIAAIQTDYDWVKAHTRLQVRALEWERAGQDKSFLLQGTDLQQAENWLVEAPEKEPEPTLMQTRYIQASRQGAVKRQRNLLVGVGAALVVTIVLGIFALIQKGIAEENARLAHIGELSATSQLSSTRFDIAMLLGVESFNAIDTFQTRNNLFKLTQLNPQVSRIMSPEDVDRIAFSPDGEILASVGWEGSIILWDADNGQPFNKLPIGDFINVSSLAFSPDGKILVMGFLGDVKDGFDLVDVSSGQIIATIPTTGGVLSFAFSPDGKILATMSSEMEIILWDVDSMQPIREAMLPSYFHTGKIAFSPDGKTLASGVGDRIILWDVASGQPTNVPLTGQQDIVSIAFSPDGKSLASSGSVINQWDIDTLQLVWEIVGNQSSSSQVVAFNPNGKTLVSGSTDRSISVVDVENGQPIYEPLLVHMGWVTDLAFSPDGKTLASCSKDGTIILWDMIEEKKNSKPPLGENGQLISTAISPDGKYLAVGYEDGNIIVQDAASGQTIGKMLLGHNTSVLKLAFSPDGKTLASLAGDGKIMLWETASGQPIFGPYDGPKIESIDMYGKSLTFSPDGKTLVSADCQIYGNIFMWDVNSGQLNGGPLQNQMENRTTSQAFSPNGKTMASAGEFGIILWDVASRLPISENLTGTPLSASPGWISSIAFSPDGKTLASGNENGSILLWDVASQQPISEPTRSILNAIAHLVYSPDGKIIVVTYMDGSLILWDVTSRQPLGDPLRGQIDPTGVYSVAFSQDGKSLTAFGKDSSLFSLDITPDLWKNQLCERVGRNFTQEEWALYFPGETYRKTCEQWPMGM
jgi:WD40 repeat protein